MSDSNKSNMVQKMEQKIASVYPESKCYEVFSTVIFTRDGSEIVVAAADKGELTKYLSKSGCGHFDESRYQHVAIFSSKNLIKDGEISE